MPTYEYNCACGYSFDSLEPMPGQQHKPCPRCGKPANKRVGRIAGIIFKGTGFHGTDYGPYGPKGKKR